jgi:hypothetical protein
LLVDRGALDGVFQVLKICHFFEVYFPREFEFLAWREFPQRLSRIGEMVPAAGLKSAFQTDTTAEANPLGDDNGKGKSKGKMRGFFAALRMTSKRVAAEAVIFGDGFCGDLA